MCGIVGYLGDREAVPVLLDSLRRLEYRGYDSAGMAVVHAGKTIVRRRAGKLASLEQALAVEPLPGCIGVGHTRWATHGPPSERNAHPHQVDGVALVHNGIVENYFELRRELFADGCTFHSDTDTEVVAHLVARAMRSGRPLVEAVRDALGRIRGSYAIAVICEQEPDRIVAARKALPLVIGVGQDEVFLASDVTALLQHTRDALFIEDGEIGVLERGKVELTTLDGRAVERAPRRVEWTVGQAERGGYEHFMLKEIHEQPRALRDTIGSYLAEGDIAVTPGTPDEAWARRITRVIIAACGTSWHAALSGKSAIEDLTRIPCEVDWAHELRYRNPIVDANTLVIAISQSGETADTLAAAQEVKARGATLWAVCNVVGASLTRVADRTLYMNAGPEISVASTKTYLCSMAVLHVVAAELGRLRGTLPADGTAVAALRELPHAIEEALRCEEQVVGVARKYAGFTNFLYLGRGRNVATAFEGALKLKEIAYAHAEGYAAGEMKHGPIALIDEQMPVVVLAPRDGSYEKLRSNLLEARARGGRIIAVCEPDDDGMSELADDVLHFPTTNPLLVPFAAAVPLQLFAYHVAAIRGLDVDRPRNLAKSVTVE
jgi:glucosamine--fructose-6-phosphate aminotransferase (isomerizing)